jgi:hypothetical protein
MWNGTAETLNAKPTSRSTIARDGHQIRAHRRGRNPYPDFVQARRAGDGVRERDPVEEERARERPQDEVLEGRLGAVRVAALQTGHDIDAQRHDLERDEDDEQVARGAHQHHAGHREQQQRVILARRQVIALGRTPRKQDRQQSNRRS